MKEKKYNRLTDVLKEKERTQTWLANQLDTSQQVIQKICANQRQMSMERLFLVAELLNIDVCDLLVRNEIKKDAQKQTLA